MTTYYGGTKATTNHVRPLAAGDFRSFVTGYLNAPVTVHHTRSRFHALPEDRQREVKNGPYFCGCSFKDGTTERADRNAEAVVLVCLDLDCKAGEPVPDYLRDIHDSPDIAMSSLHPYNAAIYATASSMPDRPRLRVVVDADRLPPSKQTLRAAVRTLAERLGIPEEFRGGSESTVISQPWFRPVTFEGEGDASPVLATRTNGRAFTVEDISDGARAQDPAGRTYAWGGAAEADPTVGLDQLPLHDMTVEGIREALFAIDPDCGYQEWTRVVAALRHQFRTEDDAREAYELFDEWSSTGSKYAGRDGTYSKWCSFQPDAIGKQCVTLRTMFKFAMDAGWKNTKVAAATKEAFEKWVDAQEDFQTLSDHFPRRLLLLPFLNEITEAVLTERVRRKLATLANAPVTATTVAKALKAERARKTAEARETETPDWLKPYCYITSTGRWVHINHGSEHGMTDTAFLTKHAIAAGEGNPLEIARKTNGVRMPSAVAYDPRFDTFFTYNGIEFLNEYHRAGIPEPVAGDGQAGRIIDAHLMTLLGERDIADMILWFLAHIVQRPGEKIRWIPIVQSAEGAGKTLTADLLKAAIGERNVKLLNPATMQTGAWNDWAYGCQFLVIEELLIAGKSRVEVANTYKDFITNNSIALTRKFEHSKTVPNVANALAFTNHHAPIHLSESNRRYMFIKSPLQSRRQVVDLTNSGHFTPLDNLLRTAPGEILHFFQNVAIPDSFPVNGPAPDTKFNRFLINESRNRASEAILETMNSGSDPLIRPDITDADHATRRFSNLLASNHPISHWLPEHGLEPWLDGERVRLTTGERVQVWVRRGWDQDVDGCPVAELERRKLAAGGLD